MSARFKVGDLVVRNPEARGETGWPYDDAVCRVVDDYPDLGTVIDVVPVNSPPNKRYQGTGWLADRFTPATTPAPRAARRNDPPTSKVAALANEVRVLTETLQRCKEVGNFTAECYRLDLERDAALLRQALEALELRCGTNADERKELIPALRERLGETK